MGGCGIRHRRRLQATRHASTFGLVAEGERIERSRRFRTGCGLATRPIAALATFPWRAVKESNHHPFECHGFQDRFAVLVQAEPAAVTKKLPSAPRSHFM